MTNPSTESVKKDPIWVNVIVHNVSQAQHHNQFLEWGEPYRVFVRKDHSITNPTHVPNHGKLPRGLHNSWMYAIKVYPKQRTY